MSTPILVVGGAGYIGSHMVKLLSQRGYHPVVLDNLSYGNRFALKWGEFIEGDLADRELLRDIISSRKIAAVMHFAAFAYVGESVTKPGRYYRNNVANTLNLLEAMRDEGCSNLIFSSTCATYGEPEWTPLTEEHPQRPINPYGRTKLVVEMMLEDFCAAHGLDHMNLRYFNAAGADPEGEIGECHDPETHLIPLVIDAALGRRENIAIFGTDYPTPDGTCIRDYIHVNDLAQAHILALEHLLDGGESRSYNLGNGQGYSVRQVIDEVARVSSRPVPTVEAPRRPGDPAVLVGSSDKIRSELGWEPQLPELSAIVETAWKWHSK